MDKIGKLLGLIKQSVNNNSHFHGITRMVQAVSIDHSIVGILKDEGILEELQPKGLWKFNKGKVNEERLNIHYENRKIRIEERRKENRRADELVLRLMLLEYKVERIIEHSPDIMKMFKNDLRIKDAQIMGITNRNKLLKK